MCFYVYVYTFWKLKFNLEMPYRLKIGLYVCASIGQWISIDVCRWLRFVSGIAGVREDEGADRPGRDVVYVCMYVYTRVYICARR